MGVCYLINYVEHYVRFIMLETNLTGTEVAVNDPTYVNTVQVAEASAYGLYSLLITCIFTDRRALQLLLLVKIKFEDKYN